MGSVRPLTSFCTMLFFYHIPNAKTVLSVASSVAASAMLIRTIAADFVPPEFQSFVFSSLSKHFSSHLTIVIEEFHGMSSNQVFEAADLYLGSLVNINTNTSVPRFKLSKSENDNKFLLGVDRNEDIVDVLDNVELKWKLVCLKYKSSKVKNPNDLNSRIRGEIRSYELSFHKKHRDKVMESYLPFILERAKAIKEETKVTKLHTVEHRKWGSKPINLDHPMSFNTLAMDPELKKTIVDDLDSFVNGKELYSRIGKTWKRGYLLYGPPGTGKSSLIAAMANYLNYNIYDMDLSSVWCNSMLRELLLCISNRSIIVFEDIDCSIMIENRESSAKIGKDKITLSGLLNFIDGILSCCGEEQIMVFTSNHRDRIDPALLRPGRMDMHIHLSYCTISAFRQLACSYHGIREHELFEEIEGLIGEIQVTPAEVSGELVKSKDFEASLQGLVKYLQDKKMEGDMARDENATKVKVVERLSDSAHVAPINTSAPPMYSGTARGSSTIFCRGRGRGRRGRVRIIP